MGRRLGPTKGRILEAAEALFAAHGFDGVSLRAIAAAADTQQALLHYHFKNKDELYRAVWARWYEAPELRQAELARIAFDPAAPLEAQLRTVVEFFLGPPVMLMRSEHGRDFYKILHREVADPKAAERGVLKEFLQPSTSLFVDILQNLLPALSPAEVRWGHEMMTAAPPLLARLLNAAESDPLWPPKSFDQALALTVDFLVDGLLGLHRRRAAGA